METKSLAEYESIKEFLELLDYQGMTHEKRQLEFIIEYVDTTEKQFDQVLQELKNVKKELHTIQSKTLKATATRAVDRVSDKVKAAKESLSEMKRHIKDTIDKGLKEFKARGKDALTMTMEKLNVKGMLQTMKKSYDMIFYKADREIDNLTKLGDEIHAVNGHFKNIGRMLLGRSPQELSVRDSNKGLISKTQDLLFRVMNKMSILSQKTEQCIEQINKRETALYKKQSVKRSLNNIKAKLPNEALSYEEKRQER